jgi:LPS export ABC transporter permease LptG/LPS export ABC transporter permease LptF
VRLLGRYIFREIVASAVLGTLLATFVVFLRGVDQIFELLVRSNASARTILLLFALGVPPVLPETIPFGVLVGILIGLGRMAADGEITAMRAAGVSSRKVILPVLFFATVCAGMAAFASLRLTPLAFRESNRIKQELEANQLTADVQPRIFVDNFPNMIIYVGEVKPGPVALWQNVFVADVTPPEKRKSGMREQATGPMITVAREALAVPDVRNNRMQLTLRDTATHEMSKDQKSQDTTAPRQDQAIDAAPPVQSPPRSSAMNTRQLMAYTGPDWVENKVELHRRFSLPVACIMLAMVGIPLGVATRKGGKSAGYVNALFLSFFGYFLSSVTLIGLAKQKTLPVPVALWLPNALFFVAGLIFLFRMEMPGEGDFFGAVKNFFSAWFGKLKSKTAPERYGLGGWRPPMLPQLLDTYVLTSFVFYVAVMLASFVSLTLIYNFFELMGDMLRNSTLVKMFTYLFFLTPSLIYTMLPISVLVAVLVTFGVLTKHNEVTAFRACGVSLHRLALPILVAATLFSGGLFAFDFYYVPKANLKQDALRDEIKGRATPQTYLNPDRKWIMGHGASRIFYYKYFDPSEPSMNGVSVFELEPKTFRLTRQISAVRAHWSAPLKTWVFEDGWSCDYIGAFCDKAAPFQASTFPELTEPPDYFLKEAVQDKQMNFAELERYIADLNQSGFDTVKLRVRLFRKFSVPFFALIMAMIAVPFGFLVGNRGAMTGIGVSIGIAMAYLAVGPLFEKIGNAGLLQPEVAAWAPDMLFGLAGMYLLLRMRS